MAEVLFIQSYFVGVWGHTWSLAVEEHFYLELSALVVYLIARVPNHPFSGIPSIVLWIAGWLMNRAIEKPVLVLRDRLFPSASGAVAVQASHSEDAVVKG
ncbi:MAG: hypothetical protein WCI02_13845 [Planctomycetota bacterium]